MDDSKINNKLFITTFLLFFSYSAFANLIEDGGFEYESLNSGWTWFDPDSDASWAWTGDNMEIWKSGFNGVVSPEGVYHAELRAHGGNGGDGWMFSQTFDSSGYASLDFSFMHRARASTNENFTFSVFSNGATTDWFIDNNFDWQHEEFSISNVGNSTTISFFVDTSSTVGSFIDDVMVDGELDGVVTPASIPEPLTFSIMGLAFIGLGIRRYIK